MQEEHKLINFNEQPIIHAGTQNSTPLEKLHEIVSKQIIQEEAIINAEVDTKLLKNKQVVIEDEDDDKEGLLLEVQVYQHVDLLPKTM